MGLSRLSWQIDESSVAQSFYRRPGSQDRTRPSPRKTRRLCQAARRPESLLSTPTTQLSQRLLGPSPIPNVSASNIPLSSLCVSAITKPQSPWIQVRKDSATAVSLLTERDCHWSWSWARPETAPGVWGLHPHTPLSLETTKFPFLNPLRGSSPTAAALPRAARCMKEAGQSPRGPVCR